MLAVHRSTRPPDTQPERRPVTLDEDFFAPLALRGEHVCDVRITASAGGPGRIGSPFGAHMVQYIDGGEFDGPMLRGRVLPGGGDWPAVADRQPLSMRIDARAVWETHDGVRLYVRYEGFLVFPEASPGSPLDVAAADPSSYYFRTTPIFSAGDERYAWLDTSVCVGVGRFAPGGLGYRIWRIG